MLEPNCKQCNVQQLQHQQQPQHLGGGWQNLEFGAGTATAHRSAALPGSVVGGMQPLQDPLATTTGSFMDGGHHHLQNHQNLQHPTAHHHGLGPMANPMASTAGSFMGSGSLAGGTRRFPVSAGSVNLSCIVNMEGLLC